MPILDALQYSDGSFSVFSPGVPMKQIEAERVEVDRNETNPEHLTRIVRVSIEVTEVLFTPTEVPQAASSELEKLRRENEALRAQLSRRAA
jgi:hypothetical protein